MDKLETLEKLLKELNGESAKMQNNKGNKATEERVEELYKLLKKESMFLFPLLYIFKQISLLAYCKSNYMLQNEVILLSSDEFY